MKIYRKIGPFWEGFELNDDATDVIRIATTAKPRLHCVGPNLYCSHITSEENCLAQLYVLRAIYHYKTKGKIYLPVC